MKRRLFVAASAAATTAAGLAPARAFVPAPSLRERLATGAETSAYERASRYADVRRILDGLDARGAPISSGSIGTSAEGRNIPYVVASRPIVHAPAEARALGRPIVLVLAGVRGADAEGPDAILALLRDLCLSAERTLLEGVVLVVVPMLDVDGIERLGAVASNAPETDGPALVGTAANASGVALDADFIAASAPETRALLQFFGAWHPDAVVELASNGGSFHRFGVTYAPSLHPASASAAFVRERMLPGVRAEMRDAYGIPSFVAGGFGRSRAMLEPPPPPSPDFGWFPRDWRPRTSANYLGLRGTLALYVSAYAHDAFERRIFSTRACVESVLGFCFDDAAAVRAAALASAQPLARNAEVPLGAVLDTASATVESIAYENLAIDATSVRQPGVPAGFRRTGTYETAEMPVYDRYAPSATCVKPHSYLIPAAAAGNTAALLALHGILCENERVSSTYTVQGYVRDGAAPGARLAEPRLHATSFGDLLIRTAQPLGALISVLLEPNSGDGLYPWNGTDTIPVMRVMEKT